MTESNLVTERGEENMEDEAGGPVEVNDETFKTSEVYVINSEILNCIENSEHLPNNSSTELLKEHQLCSDSNLNTSSCNQSLNSGFPLTCESTQRNEEISADNVSQNSNSHELAHCSFENNHVFDARQETGTESAVKSQEKLPCPNSCFQSNDNAQANNASVSSVIDCKFSCSEDSLSCSDTPLEGSTVLETRMCHNSRSNDCSNLNPTFQCSEDEADSLSEWDSEYGQAEVLLPSSWRHNSADAVRKKRKHGTRRSGPTIDYYETQIEFLENNNKKLLLELAEMRNKFTLQENEYKKNQIHAKDEFESKIGKLSQLCETLKKDKEAMVIRYANSEKEVILAKKTQTELEKKLKEANRERDLLSHKIKNFLADKQRMCSNLDQKSAELSNLHKDYERLKDDMGWKDIEIKRLQNRLKREMDSHKETQTKLEHNIQRLQEKREEAEQVRKDCQEMVRRYQEAEEIKSVKLDHQLKQKLSELEVQKQERCDQEEVYQLLRQELEALKKKQRITIEENNNLTLKIHGLEKERLEYEQTLSKLKDNLNSLKQEVVDLTARLAEMQNLGLQLEREKEKVSANVREVERLRQTNAELQADMDACHMKEGELLEFTERLTAKTVHLQSEHSLLEAKSQALEDEVTQLNKKNADMEQKISDLVASLEEERKQGLEETQLLARKLAEKTKIAEQLSIKLEEADNENRVMKRRHIASIKELSRELYQCRKRLETFETNTSCQSDAVSLGSRASSSASLDTAATNSSIAVVNSTPIVPQVSPQVVFSGRKNNVTVQNATAIPQEVDKQMLIERIVKLQKILAKKNDKIEFLEDHNGQLVKEMKKKSKIIQNYILKEETGALISNKSDQNKLDLSKRGGIMASVYSSQLSDNNMTLELSLEINQKLQAVLEDTLLKNITLKENINTLGEEIARLTAEKRDISRQLARIKM